MAADGCPLHCWWWGSAAAAAADNDMMAVHGHSTRVPPVRVTPRQHSISIHARNNHSWRVAFAPKATYTPPNSRLMAAMNGTNARKMEPPSLSSSPARGSSPSRPSFTRLMERARWSPPSACALPPRAPLPPLLAVNGFLLVDVDVDVPAGRACHTRPQQRGVGGGCGPTASVHDEKQRQGPTLLELLGAPPPSRSPAPALSRPRRRSSSRKSASSLSARCAANSTTL